MKKFLPQNNSFTVDFKINTWDFMKMTNHIFIFYILVFCAPLFAQQTVIVDNPAGGFNINGSLTSTAIGDWVKGSGSGGFVINNDGSPVNTTISARLTDGFKGSTTPDLIFTAGSKFNDNPNTWQWSDNDAGGKGDINNVMYHIGNNIINNQQFFIVAGDRKETQGTSYIDFEFLQNTLTRNPSTGSFNSAGPNGGRTENDVVISIKYENGGSAANIQVYLWKYVGGSWTYILQTVDPTRYYGFTNGTNQNVPFGAFGSTTYTANQFVEATFNITKVFEGIKICDGLKIKTIMVKTKSSDVLTAALDDFMEPIQVGLNLGTASINYNGPFCQIGTAPVTHSGITGGTYSAPAGLVIDTNTGQINLANSIPGTYTVTYSYKTGICTDDKTATTIVTINPFPVAPTATVTNPTCDLATGSIKVTAPAANGMTYSIDRTNYTNTSGIFNGLATGNYSVTAKSAAGCISPATSVTIDPQPITPVTPVVSAVTQPTCSTATGSFTITNYNGLYTYTFSPSVGVMNSAGVVSAPAGTYIVNATLGTCSSAPSTNIVINTQPLPPTADACQDLTINCANPSASLMASGGVSYSWSPATGLSATNIANPIATPTINTTYTVTVTSAEGCTATDYVIVTVDKTGPTANAGADKL